MSGGLRLEDFDIVKEIGKGGFGVVYEATHPQFHRVALKKINCGAGGVPFHRIRSEYELLNNVSHNNIIKFYGQFKAKNDVYLVLELCPLGSMRSYVRKNGPLTEAAAAYVLKQLLCAVQQLHAKKIMHRDLSAGNILISKMSSDGLLPTIKICDFGLARSMRTGGPPRTIVGTPGFMAPELLVGDSYDEAADVFSLGAALYTMLTGEDPPVKGKPALGNVCSLAGNLITSMMAHESQRISLREIFVSDFMKRYLPDNRVTLNSFYGSREHSVDRARSSIERRRVSRRSGSEDRRFSRDVERYSRGRREHSYDRRASDREANANGFEKEENRRRAASQPPPRESRRTKDRVEESGFQSGGDHIYSRPLKKTPLQSTLPTAVCRKDQPWPLRTERLNGKVFIRPKIGRLRVTDMGDIVYEQESATGTVAIIMLVHFPTTATQEINFYSPVSASKSFPKQDDPRVEYMRSSRRGPFTVLSALDDNDLKVYNSVRHMLVQLKSQVDKVVLRRSVQFPMSAAKIMENGDFRVVPIVDDASGVKLVRKTTNGRIVYRRYTGSDGGSDITDDIILNKMNSVYDLLLDIESIVERSGQRFPFLMSSGPSSSFPMDSLRALSINGCSASYSSQQFSMKQQSIASAPSIMESRVFKDVPRTRLNASPYIVKDIGRGCVSVRHALDGRFLRMSTGVANVLIYRQNEHDAKGEIRFDVRDTNIPGEARDLVEKVKQVVKERRRKAC